MFNALVPFFFAPEGSESVGDSFPLPELLAICPDDNFPEPGPVAEGFGAPVDQGLLRAGYSQSVEPATQPVFLLRRSSSPLGACFSSDMTTSPTKPGA